MKGLIKMTKKLYGYAVKENVIYQWSSESGACEVCKEMDGKLFESTDEIPDRPHPNCKCHIEILEKESDEINKDPIEAHRKKIKDTKRNELELAKLLGDTKSLEEEIDEYIRQVNKQEKELNKLENSIDINKLEFQDQQKVKDVKEQINSAKYKAEKTKQHVNLIKNKVDNVQYSNDMTSAIDKLYYYYEYAKAYSDSLVIAYYKNKKEIDKVKENMVKIAERNVIKYANKERSLALGAAYLKLYNMPESYELFKIALGVDNYNEKYVNKNGKLYSNIKNLNNEQKIKDIQTRIQEEKFKGKEKMKMIVKFLF